MDLVSAIRVLSDADTRLRLARGRAERLPPEEQKVEAKKAVDDWLAIHDDLVQQVGAKQLDGPLFAWMVTIQRHVDILSGMAGS